jgi:lycopene cyclase domain-containing protein
MNNASILWGDSGLTYARFLVLFVGLPIVGFLVLARMFGKSRGSWLPLVLLLGVAYVTTTPWDSWAVRHGLWEFNPQRIWGIRLFSLPLEELLFFGLQTVLTGLWVRRRLSNASRSTAEGVNA